MTGTGGEGGQGVGQSRECGRGATGTTRLTWTRHQGISKPSENSPVSQHGLSCRQDYELPASPCQPLLSQLAGRAICGLQLKTLYCVTAPNLALGFPD